MSISRQVEVRVMPVLRKGWCLALLAAGLLFAALPRAHAANENVNGSWSPVYSWPLIPVHAALTPDGRILTYGTKADGTQTGYFIYDVWDPAGGYTGGHLTLNNLSNTDIFCSSQVILPQSGNIFIAGGDNWTGTNTTNTGNNNSNFFNPTGNTLTRGTNMFRQRWYSSSTVMMNGEVLVMGGTGGGDLPEVLTTSNTFRLLSNVNVSALATVFPRNFLAPDGRIFGYDTNGVMYYITPAGTGLYVGAGQFSSSSAGWTSSAAMYRPGKILQMGGNSNSTVIIDITGPQPVVTSTQLMNTQRQWVSATVLPNGKVLATGGSTVENQLTGVNNTAAIWDPATGQWTLGAAGALARLYHSGAILLPDATVMITGGGAPGPLVNTNVEIYTPPYLYNASSQLAARPSIVSAPSAVDPGTSFSVQTDGTAISRVTLVKTGSITHSVNMDQRFVELSFTQSANMLQVQLPLLETDTPPGYYMLFVLNGAGVPSVAKIVKINIDANPNMAVNYTPAMGGGGGSNFTVACNADEALVGIYGRYGTFINQVGAQCVKVDQFGRWNGTPVNRGLTGTTTTGTAFTKTCPTNYAMSGYRGSYGTQVTQIDIECKALTATGTVTGAGQFQGATGAAGGTAGGPFSCGTGNPVYALYGRSGTLVDQFGVQCRQTPITPVSVNSAPLVTNPGALTGSVGIAVDRTIQASDPNGDPLTFSATGLPAGLGIATTTGRITGTPTTVAVNNTTVTVTDGTTPTSVSFTWTISAAMSPLSLDPMPVQLARQTGVPVTYTATARNGLNPVYKWYFDDGTPETAYSSSASITKTWTVPGIHYVSVTANDDRGQEVVQTFSQQVYLPLTTNPASNSSNLAYETRSGSNSRLWIVNQDNDTVSAFDAVTNTKLAEIAVGSGPRSVAVAPNGRVWVANKFAASISIIDPATLAVVQTVPLTPSSQPFGIAFSPTGNYAYVALEGAGRLLKLDPASGAQVGSLAVGANVRQLSVSGDGTKVYVSRFVSPPLPGEGTANVQTAAGGGEVVVVDANAMSVSSTIVLAFGNLPDAENQGSGLPNYLGGAAISPDGTQAWVPSKLDNITRGGVRNGLNLTFQNTVRAVSSRINLATGVEDLNSRIDHDNASMASAATYDKYGDYLFVALETSREVAVIDAHGKYQLFRINVGRAPQGVVVSPDGLKLYVSNFMDRTVSVFDLTPLIQQGQWSAPLLATLPSVATEKLSAQVLNGKQLFYDAADTRLARDKYMSCASCHNDGGQDGRVWDMTGFGEGLRNTIALRGRAAAHGFSHWSGNFDEIQDFEGQIRALAGGTGLMDSTAFLTGTRNQPLGDPKAGLSADLDALAAYVASLNTFAGSPYRNTDGSLTTAATAGKAVFRTANCAQCHSGAAFTDSGKATLRNIGTIKPTSGQRLGGPLNGIDTPTLRDVWATAPYLHDGSAATLADAVSAHSNVTLTSTDLANVVAYLQQIDSSETTAPCASCSGFDGQGSPTLASSGDPGPLELGVKFRSDVNGYVTGIRFYKGAANTGTHVGSLWSAAGALLARATFTYETASGWQQVNFDTPVAVTAGTVYVASYFAPNGNYAFTANYFANAGADNGSIHLLQNGVAGGNGVFLYTAAPGFPNGSFNSANYWVDVAFSTSAAPDTTAPTVTGITPAAGATGVTVGSAVSITFSEAVDPATIGSTTIELRNTVSNLLVSASIAYNAATQTATLTPSSALANSTSYTLTVKGGLSDPRVKDTSGNALAANITSTFTTEALVVDTTPPTVTARTPANGAANVAITSAVTVTFSEAMLASTINGTTIELRDAANALVAATVTYTAATNTATLTPTASLANSTTYTLTVKGGATDPRVKDAASNALAANSVSTFTTAAASTGGSTLSAWPSTATPAVASSGDPGAVELGVKFRSDVPGYITGIRYYKGSGNTGTHTGSLWSLAGVRLATATFTGETASGWQQVNFATPVAITANTVYVASYYAPAGNYAYNSAFFATTGVDNGTLHLLQNGVSGGNGLFAYGAVSSFPNGSYNSTNYWVDVVFSTTSGTSDTTPPTISSRTPASGATGVAINSSITATFSESMDVATISSSSIELRTSGGTLVPATVSYNATSFTATLTPTAVLALSSTYTVTIKGGATDPRVKDAAGNALAANSAWSFTTAAVDPCAANAITAENCLAGNPQSEWDIAGVGDATIQGFATQMSVNKGNTVSFKVKTDAAAYRLDIYRLGYYAGLGARKVATVTPSASLPQTQPNCINDTVTGLVDCGNWGVSASWAVPSTATTGVYLARLVRTDTGGASHIVFVVRDDASTSDVLFQTPDTTWQAYNEYGGNSLYFGSPAGRSYKVSYNRPFITRGNKALTWLFDATYPMLRWLESNGYNMAYVSGLDVDQSPAMIRQHKTFLSVGHDEYWSGAQRANVEAARDAGVHLGFFSGNSVFWKTRWEASIDGTNTANRTLTCYKETHANAKIDPLTNVWTGTWRDPRFSPPADGNRPENGLKGTIFTVNTGDGAIAVPSTYSPLRFWRNTTVASLTTGQTATMPMGTLGFEWEEDLDNGFRPAGLIRMSSSTVAVAERITDYGSTYAPGNATHNLTLYKAPSGALVFSTGTIRWSWALDATHDFDPNTPNGVAVDTRLQQATVNILADMRSQPATLKSGLVAATASTDATAPTAVITSPANGASIVQGSVVTITGTATDAGGGVVAAVEVSTDGGATWHPATGLASWTYSWTAGTLGSFNIKVRAADDSGNLQTAGAGNTVTVAASACPCTAFDTAATPAIASSGDPGQVELGVKFTSNQAGKVTGVRFYKGTANTGTHVGKLWTVGGALLGTVTFTGETASGWQQANFATPINITANTVYVVSYYAPNGNYAFTASAFSAGGVTRGPLTLLQNGVNGGNGVFFYGAGGGFPNGSYNSANYWVDVVFSP